MYICRRKREVVVMNRRWRREGDEGDGEVLSSGACDWAALNYIHNTYGN